VKVRKFQPVTLILILLFTIFISTLNLSLTIPEVQADTSDSGLNFFTNAIDKTPASGSWVDVDCSANIPSGSTGVMLDVHNTDGVQSRSFDVRQKGSTDDHYSVNSVWTNCHTFAIVGVDSNRIFQAKTETSSVHIFLIGYTDDRVILFENAVDYQITTYWAWTDIDASATIPAGATGVIGKIVGSGDAEQMGMRHPSSTDDKHLDSRCSQWALCGVNSSRCFQGYAEDADVDHYVLGYTKAPVQFEINMIDKSLGVTGSFQDIDVTGDTEAGATGVIILITSSSGWYKGAIRMDGSTDDRTTDSKIYTVGMIWGYVGLGSGEIFEGYIEHVDIDFFIIGYTKELVISDFVYPDHVDDEYKVTNSTYTMDDDGDYTYFNSTNAWIIWDFAEEVANVTELRWELAYTGTGQGWKIEASSDKASWDILVQCEQTDYSMPPLTKNSSSRYDSEVHKRYRYLKLTHLKGVAGWWWMDFICFYTGDPIVYSDATYKYANKLMYFRWDTYGSSQGKDSYMTRPHNALGESRSANYTGNDMFMKLVNKDFHPDNRLIVAFDTYYDISEIGINFAQPSSDTVYVYISDDWEDELDDWTLIGTKYEAHVMEWWNIPINATYKRFVRIEHIGSGSNTIQIDCFRLKGSINVSGPEPEPFDFSKIPEDLADALGISLLAGQLLMSAIILFMFLLPMAIWSDKDTLASVIVGLVLLAFLTAVQWLPYWIMLVISLVIAGVYGYKFSKWYSGR